MILYAICTVQKYTVFIKLYIFFYLGRSLDDMIDQKQWNMLCYVMLMLLKKKFFSGESGEL